MWNKIKLYKNIFLLIIVIIAVVASFFFGRNVGIQSKENQIYKEQVKQYEQTISDTIESIEEYNRQTQIDFERAFEESERRQQQRIDDALRRDRIVEATSKGVYIDERCVVDDEILEEINNALR